MAPETSETFHKSPGSLGDEDFACVLCVCVCVARQCSESWLVQMWYSWGSSSVWLFLLPVICATAFPGRLSACRKGLESLSARCGDWVLGCLQGTAPVQTLTKHPITSTLYRPGPHLECQEWRRPEQFPRATQRTSFDPTVGSKRILTRFKRIKRPPSQNVMRLLHHGETSLSM